MAKTNLGEMTCETCCRVVVVKENESGTLSYRCDYCDAAPYARQGSMQSGLWRKKIKPFSGPPEAQEPPPKTETAPTGEPVPPRGRMAKTETKPTLFG